MSKNKVPVAITIDTDEKAFVLDAPQGALYPMAINLYVRQAVAPDNNNVTPTTFSGQGGSAVCNTKMPKNNDPILKDYIPPPNRAFSCGGGVGACTGDSTAAAVYTLGIRACMLPLALEKGFARDAVPSVSAMTVALSARDISPCAKPSRALFWGMVAGGVALVIMGIGSICAHFYKNRTRQAQYAEGGTAMASTSGANFVPL
jgi:hypothetical protein